MKKKIVVLGCTGSIGKSTLKIIDEFSDLFQVVGLTAHSNKNQLDELSKKYNCKNICLSNPSADGVEGIKRVIADSCADICVNGIAGAAGLLPSIYTLENGINLALANKETIVMASHIVYELAAKNKCKILPVDSEHSAIFNLVEKFGKDSIESVVLTASGGPFRTFTKEQLEKVTVEDALKHPTWNMGQKITIDSATLANKALEVIEAVKLFGVPASKVEVTIHPQSLVHSLIRTKDGVLYSQMSHPDMCHPILSALTWPDFTKSSLPPLDLSNNPVENPLTCTFAKPDLEKFPMLALGFKAASLGNAYPIAFNAANEIAVEAFINHKIGFYDISRITENVLNKDWSRLPVTYNEVLLFDSMAREFAKEQLC